MARSLEDHRHYYTQGEEHEEHGCECERDPAQLSVARPFRHAPWSHRSSAPVAERGALPDVTRPPSGGYNGGARNPPLLR